MVAIRGERPEDADAIEAIYLRAFGPGRFAKTAERLREGNAHLIDLSFVAEVDGEVVGAVRLWPLAVGGRDVGLLFLGPIAVEKEWRRDGIGEALSQACLDAAREAGWKAVCLVGDTWFFGPLGFVAGGAGTLTLPGPVDPSRFLTLELADGGLSGIAGCLSVPRDARPASEDQPQAPSQAIPAAATGSAKR